jgi:protoheme IX farnesyltransferase
MSRWLHRFAWLLVVATFFLIVAGASVTSNRAGLAVPDWPATYEHHLWRFPLEKMVGGIFYEHGHRLIASIVGLMTTALTLWIFFTEKQRPWLRKLAIAALAGVILQGLLGGLTVKLLLPPSVSIAHAALAQAFFCVTVALALVTGARWETGDKPAHSKLLTGLALALTAAVYIQLILGASIRHSERGLLAHIAGALGVALVAVLLVRQRPLPRAAEVLGLLLIVQLALGLLTLYTRQPKLAPGQLSPVQVWLPTLHLATGALILATSFALTLRLFWGATVRAPLGAYLEMAKPRIVSLVLVTTGLGFFLGGQTGHAWPLLLVTLLGVGAATGGAAVLNNYLDRDVDAKMARTRNRALPTGRVAPAQALAFGVTLVLVGVLALVWAVNLLTGFLVLLAAFLYVLVYTPLKRMSWFNTTIGAIPGALPPMCGWAAATGELTTGAWVLFAILFLWQHPHFFAIAWMFKEDYRQAGLKMLPVVDPSGRRTFRQTILYSVLLLAGAALPYGCGLAGPWYLAGSFLLGGALLAVAVRFIRSRSYLDARRLLKASVIYLPLLVVLMVLDRL